MTVLKRRYFLIEPTEKVVATGKRKRNPKKWRNNVKKLCVQEYVGKKWETHKAKMFETLHVRM